MYLENINNPNDLKKLNYDELEILAKEVRKEIIDITSTNGGHLASSLGVVELTIALIRSYDFPKDKIIWDVGHQSYAYKILTDRKDVFSELRSYGGISGFPKRKESIYDSFDTGHSSTSISAGLGICVGRDLNKEKFNVVSVIGDGSLTGGMAFEALNNLSKLKSNYIIILNDNNMSIAKNDGGISHALSGIRTSYRYLKIKKIVKTFLGKIVFGKQIKHFIIKLINMLKQIFVSSGMLFENLDIIYLGIIDGHNILKLEETIKKAKKLDRAVIIHIKTIKGKGYKFAEENPTFYHGVAPFNIDTGKIKVPTGLTYTDVFSNTIVKLAKENENIVAITAAMPDGTGLIEFKNKFKDRFFDVGICEQHAVTFSAGLSLQKKIPIVAIYSSFLQRGFDQIIHDVCLQNLHVVFAIDRSGLVGADGETHQGIFDISYLKLIPNMVIMAPKNAKELEKMLEFAVNKVNNPIAIRYPRGKAYEFDDFIDNEIQLGKAEILYKGKEVSLFAFGSMVSTAIHLREKLKNKNIDATVVNLRFAKPIDYELIDNICLNHNKIVILEEGVLSGSIGEEIECYISEHYNNKKVIKITLPDNYVEHGNVTKIRELLSIDSDSILKKVFNAK